ncbi:MAG: transporter substrate-binding domain-containing protein [Paludibacter sp.]|nr:transporter substrate-binding domain-containing protein [Paludibacter sp.]
MKTVKQKNKTIMIVIVALLLLFWGIITNIFYKKAVRANELIVVIDSGRFRYAEHDDSIFGLQYEILNAFADSAKMKLQIIKQNDLKQSIYLLLNGECDLVATPIPTTTEYIDLVQFTVPILSTLQVIVQIPDSAGNVKNKQYDLAYNTITLPANSPQIQRIKNLSDEIADTIFIHEIPNITIDELVEKVAQGEYKYTICPMRLAKKLKGTYPNINITMPIGFEQSYSWAVNKKNQKLLEELNNFLKDFMNSDTYKAIYEKYK